MRLRGAATAGVLCLLLAACQDEPDFDERYDAAETRIRKTAAELDQELEQARRDGVSDEAAGEAAPPARTAGDRTPTT